MKTVILLSFIITTAFFSSCKKASTETLDQVINPADTTATVELGGTFMNGPSGKVSGQAKIYFKEGKYILALENFSTSNGPDLKVYLSQEMFPATFIKLGDLQSTNGNQLYDVPGKPDFSLYKYALIHCEKYNHLYGYAELSK
ncbi:MAG: DM13 domain-containing protein [Ginsengibacter sp.]